MRVGVLVPVHGFAPFLAEALDSVLEQDVAPDAVVVVDDGSPEPVGLHPDYAGRVELVRRDVSGGPATARATGERWEEPVAGRHRAAALGAELYERNPVPTSSVVLRRDALEAVGGFESVVHVAEDWELWLRLAGGGADAVCVPEAVVRYRRHPGGLTADVARLAAAQLAVHGAHGHLVDEDTRRRVEAADLAAMAAGCTRERRFGEARRALREAADRVPPTPRQRAARALLAVPGARRALGRRDPYRR
jgi:GT2 family glycosyltransferase